MDAGKQFFLFTMILIVSLLGHFFKLILFCFVCLSLSLCVSVSVLPVYLILLWVYT